MNLLTVEPATWRDADAIYKLRLKLEADTQEQTGIESDASADVDAQYFYETLGWFFDPGKVVFVARADSGIVGYLAAMAATYVGKAKGISVIGFYVEEPWRTSSAAKLLLKLATSAVRNSNTKRVQAVIMLNNKRMLKAVTRMKFKPVAIVFDLEVKHGKLIRE